MLNVFLYSQNVFPIASIKYNNMFVYFHNYYVSKHHIVNKCITVLFEFTENNWNIKNG